MAEKKLPRGARLNNPTNMEFGQKYKGEVIPSSDSRFAQFETAVKGFRANGKDFKSKARRGVDTIRKLIYVWAPPKNNKGEHENHTEAYIASVCKETGFHHDEVVDLTKYEYARPIIKAMSRVENGGWYFKDADLDKGLAEAGVLPEQKPLAKSRTIQGGAVAVASVGGIGLSEVKELVEPVKQTVEGLKEAAPLLAQFAPYAKYGLIALAVAGLAYLIYARWDDHRRGKR